MTRRVASTWAADQRTSEAKGMGVIFISYSLHNRDIGDQFRRWLAQEGYDVDEREAGTFADDRGLQTNAAGVVALISPDWVKSEDCQRDIRAAQKQGKAIVVVQVAPTPQASIPDGLLGKGRTPIDASATETPNWQPVKDALSQVAARPSDFARPAEPFEAFRGLRTFEEGDAAVFFGRDAEVTAVLDAVRRVHTDAPERVFAIVGRCGAGKTSFLRAGVLARLQRDAQRFVVLPIVGGSGDIVRGPQGLLAALGLEAVPDDEALTARLTALAEGPDAARTIVLPVDEAEGLLAVGDADAEAGRSLLHRCLAACSTFAVLATVRDEQLGLLDRFDRTPAVPVQVFRLPAPSDADYRAIISQTGASAEPPMRFSMTDTGGLLADLDQPDGLVLLAFALSRVVELYPHSSKIDLDDYHRSIGGLAGVINAAVAAAYEMALRDPSCPTNRTVLDGLARRIFIPALVRFDTVDAAPKRRVALAEALPDGAMPLLRHFAAQGLVNIDKDGGATRVSVVHEAVLRNWWNLAEWIREERITLERLQRLTQSAEAWDVTERSRELLIHRGVELAEAEALFERPDFQEARNDALADYLSACRASEQQRNEGSVRRQRWRRFGRGVLSTVVWASALIGLVALVLGYFAVRSKNEQRSWALVEQSRRALDEGHDDRAVRLAVLAAQSSVLSPSADGARFQLASAILRARRLHALPHDSALVAGVMGRDGTRALTVDAKGNVHGWREGDDQRWSTRVLSVGNGVPMPARAAMGGAALVVKTAEGFQVWDQDADGGWRHASLEDADDVAIADRGGWVLTVRGASASLWSSTSGACRQPPSASWSQT
ncbi:MAG: toll/interleukin-1 receptor domain-containing protein [Myxococcota bacterium]